MCDILIASDRTRFGIPEQRSVLSTVTFRGFCGMPSRRPDCDTGCIRHAVPASEGVRGRPRHAVVAAGSARKRRSIRPSPSSKPVRRSHRRGEAILMRCARCRHDGCLSDAPSAPRAQELQQFRDVACWVLCMRRSANLTTFHDLLRSGARTRVPHRDPFRRSDGQL